METESECESEINFTQKYKIRNTKKFSLLRKIMSSFIKHFFFIFFILILFNDETNTSVSSNNSNIKKNSINYNNNNNHGDGIHERNNNNCCNETITNHKKSGHRVEIQFTSKVVQNEYIVAFNNYYKSTARENYLKSALNNSNVSFSKIFNLLYIYGNQK